MATAEEKRARAINDVLAANQGESADVKEAAIRGVIGNPSQAATDEIWRLLIFGMLLLLIVALGGLLIILVGKGSPHDAALTVFTTTLAGLLGLFAPSPLKSNGGGDGNTPPASQNPAARKP